VAEHHVSYAPSEDQELIRSTARGFLDDRFGMDRVRELMMSDDGFEREAWKEMADLGWTGLTIAEEHGGTGLGPIEMTVLLEEMGRSVTPGPFFASAVLATTAVQQIATASEQASLLPGLASGETIATVALFDEPRGWDVVPSVTRASRVGEGWRMRGGKRAVLDGHMADLLLVTAAVDDEIGLFAVTPETAGFSIVQEHALDPTRRQSTLSLVNVELPLEARIGDGDVSDGLVRSLQLATVALAAEQLGGAARCLEMSVDYAKTRYQFGRPIGSYQAIKHRCANMLMRVEHARSTAYYAARVIADPDELAVAAPLAGSIGSETYVWVAGENIQVHGGIGFTWEHDAHIFLKRAKASSLLFGTPRHQRDQLGRAIGI
jgi:alkylation response protein AidB-like acyl-CoA dehydrogenase